MFSKNANLSFQIWPFLGFCCVLKSVICFSKTVNLRFEKTNYKYLKNKFKKTQISNIKDKFHKTQREGKRVKSTILKNKFVFVGTTNLYFIEIQICVSKHKYITILSDSGTHICVFKTKICVLKHKYVQYKSLSYVYLFFKITNLRFKTQICTV